MAYSDDIAKLSRSESVLIQLNLDNLVVGGDWISMGNTPPDSGNSIYPCVQDIQWIPSRAEPDGGLGYFGDIVITAKDFPWNQGLGNGSFFGRMIGSNPYYLNRTIDVYVGYYEIGDTYNLSNYQKRTYFLKRIDGPTEKGVVKFYASDAVSRMKESEIPVATSGNLAATLTIAATGSTNIGDNTGFSASGGYAIIDDEIVAYSGITGGDSITISTRAQGGTVAEEHDADAPVRNIYQSSGNVVDEIRNIIENFTDIDHAAYIPDTDWNNERDTYLNGDNVEIWITEPRDVSDVIDQICRESFINVWWDDSAQEIKLQALGPTLSAITKWTDDDHILDAAIRVKRDQKKVLTAVWYFYGKINKAEGKDGDNMENLYINARTSIETDLGEPRVKKIFSEFIPAGTTGTADKVSTRLIDQYEFPTEMTLHVDAKDSAVNVGDAVEIETDLIQDSQGGKLPTIMRVIEKSQKKDNKYFYRLVKTGQETGDRYFLWASDTVTTSYTSATDEEKSIYGWWSDDDPDVNGDDPFLWQ